MVFAPFIYTYIFFFFFFFFYPSFAVIINHGYFSVSHGTLAGATLRYRRRNKNPPLTFTPKDTGWVTM